MLLVIIEDHELELVRQIMEAHIVDPEVWAFGSRVHGRNIKPFSDLDLVIMKPEKISALKLSELKDAFSESDLPFFVDVSCWHDLPSYLQEIIQGESQQIL